MALPATASVSVAKVQPKDVIVLEVPGYPTQENLERLQAQLRPLWPHNEIVVLGQGMTIKVVKGDA